MGFILGAAAVIIAAVIYFITKPAKVAAAEAAVTADVAKAEAAVKSVEAKL